jgi:predicted transcriptional regulator
MRHWSLMRILWLSSSSLVHGAEGKHLFAMAKRMLYSLIVSATEIIEQFKALPPNERAQVAKFVVEHDDSWIPESFTQGMADAAEGRFVDMETVLSGAKPPSRAAE